MKTIQPFDPVKFARQKGFKLANVKLKDGSNVKVLDNMRDTVHFFHYKDGEIIGAKGYKCTDLAKSANFFAEVCDRIAEFAADNKNVVNDILSQLIHK